MSTCKACGGTPIECGVCSAEIEGECERKDAVSECCTDGGHYCKSCGEFAHARCWNDYAKACNDCASDGGDDGLQRDDNAARVRDMNAELRGGRFYR